MPELISRLRRIRWYQWTMALIVLLYIVYIALSYLYLPGKLKRVVQTDVSALIGREIAVSEFQFNPFTLSLGIEALSVADRPGKPLVGWERLFVNVGFWKSLFKLEIALNEFSIVRPEINIEKNASGFNYGDILDRFAGDDMAAPPAPDQEETPSRIALEIARTAIVQGSFHYTDESGSVPVSSHMDDVTIEVENIYLATGDENLNPFDLTAKLPGGGDLRLNGRYRIDPLQVDAEISANAVLLSAFSGFLENILPVKIENGELSFGTRILAKQAAELQLQADEGHLEITGLDLSDGTRDPALFQMDLFSISGASFDLSARQVSVERVLLDGILATQWMDESGRLRYKDLLPEATESPVPATSPPADSAAPWEVVLHQVDLQDGAFHFEDRREATAQQHGLTEIALSLGNVTLAPGESTPLSFSARLDRKGSIRAEGSLLLSPFAMAVDYGLENIPLAPFSGYVEAGSALGIESGSLGVTGSATMGRDEKDGLTATLDLSVTDLRTEDTRTGDPVLNLAALDLADIALDTGARTVTVSGVTLSAPELFTRVSREKAVNLATLAGSGGETAPTESPEAGSGAPTGEAAAGPAWNFAILATGMADGTVHYTDLSTHSEFSADLLDLNLEVGPIASDRTEPTDFSLTGNIDRYAPISVTGSLLPLDRQPGFSFTTRLEGLEMPGLSPYSATFIGNHLKSGKLSLTLDYSLADRKLKGKNNIVADNLYLGEKVPSETAITAPVGLGLALMRDHKGVIDLDVGVSGDLDDPGFSISGIISKALLNIITKAAASPFKLLGALAGSDENLGEIEFSRGAALLTPQNEARLKQLSEALAQRPQLALAIQGNASTTEDSAAIKARKLLEQVAGIRGLTAAEIQAEAGEANWWETPENRDALTVLNDALPLATVSERSQRLQTEKPELKDETLNVEVFRKVYEDLESDQSVNTMELLSLADARALAIKQYLVDDLGIDHQRVSVTKAREAGLTGLSLTLEIEAM